MQSAKQHKHIYNTELPNTKIEGFSSIYRKTGITSLTQSPKESIKTIRDLLNFSKQKYGVKNGIGEIKVIKQDDGNGKQIQKRLITQHTYNEVYEHSYNLGKYIYSKGLYVFEELMKLKLVGVYAKNRYEWFLADWAFALFGITNVPLYDTLGVQNLTFCLNQTEIITIFASNATLQVLLQLTDIGKLKTVILFDPIDENSLALIKTHNLNVLDFWEIIKEGQSLKNVSNDDIVINTDDCSTFSYTSGTTGPPKGAMISNRNILSCLSGFSLHKDLYFSSDDRYLSYLPLPHLMERTLTFYLFYVGANVIVSSGNTLKIREDCEAIKPTILISVPRLFSKIAENIKNKFVEMKLPTFHHPGIFAKVRESFGACIRFMGTGSAPINPQVHKYLKQVFACPFIQGYGQTQSSAGAFFSRSNDPYYGNLSEISTSLEVKLCDIPQMKYSSQDVNEKGQRTPRGQLWERGPAVFLGYYKSPEQTKEAITEQGWLKTGDVVEINPNNNGFRIIDRKKNIFKLQQGEYLAPDKIENIYMKSHLTSQAFLHGDSQQYYAVVVITPNKEILSKFAGQNGITGTHEQLCANKNIKNLVLSEINKLGKSQGLNGFQLAKNIYLEPKGFMFKKNILTNTMKLIRYEARQVYKAELQQLYEQGQLSLK